MDLLAFCQSVHHDDSLLSLDFSDGSFDHLAWDNAMAVSPESVFIKESYTDYSQVWEKKQSWTHLLENNIGDNNNLGSHGINHALHSPVMGSTHSSFEQIQCASYVKGNNKSFEGEIVESKKRRKRIERGPIFVFNTRSPTDILDDGYKWRKYGKKSIKNSPHKRSYYFCSDSNCVVKKKVERDSIDREVVITTYEGKHNHESPCPMPVYCVVKPMVVQQPASEHAIVLLNAGLCC